MMEFRRARTWVPMALLLGLTSGACVPGSGDGPEPTLGAVSSPRSEADLVLPLDVYRLTQEEYATTIRAHWRLTRTCATRFGVTYTASESDALADPPRLDRMNARRYGVIDPANAARSGYNDADGQPQSTGPRPSAKAGAGWTPTPTEHLVISGKAWVGAAQFSTMPTDRDGKVLPDDGCAGEAYRGINAGLPVPANENLAEALASQAHQRAENDSRVQAATRLWSDCMKRSGYSYSSIWGPNDRNWPEPPALDEVATAKADVACKLETNLVGMWLAVETAYQMRLIDRNAEALASVKEYVRNQVRNASRVLAGG